MTQGGTGFLSQEDLGLIRTLNKTRKTLSFYTKFGWVNSRWVHEQGYRSEVPRGCACWEGWIGGPGACGEEGRRRSGTRLAGWPCPPPPPLVAASSGGWRFASTRVRLRNCTIFFFFFGTELPVQISPDESESREKNCVLFLTSRNEKKNKKIFRARKEEKKRGCENF